MLNASRHHRKNRLFFESLFLRFDQVLNASRHHRKKRTAIHRSATAYHPVLNASRHHRKNRLQVMSDEAGTIMCSTPRGITGKIARRLPAAWVARPRAQRLAASPEKSRMWWSE